MKKEILERENERVMKKEIPERERDRCRKMPERDIN